MSENVQFYPLEQLGTAAHDLWEVQRARLEQLLPYADVLHVGSTAVPGSLTKGDLDIQVRVPPSRFEEASALLARHYPRNTKSTSTEAFTAFEDPSGAVPLGIQLTAIDSEYDVFWRFRDLFLRQRDLVESYNALKRAHEGGDMTAYRADKDKFFDALRETPEFRALTFSSEKR